MLFEKFAETMDERSVFVTNISSQADEKAVREFFDFCGEIDSMNIQPAEDGTLQAVVIFVSPESAQTAKLMSNAVIVDQAVTVGPVPPTDDTPSQANGTASSVSTTAAEYASSFFAGTYKVGSAVAGTTYKVASYPVVKTKEGVKYLDEKTGVSKSVNAGITTTKEKVNAVDSQLGVSATIDKGRTAVNTNVIAPVSSGINHAATSVNEALHIQAGATAAVNGVKSTSSAVWKGATKIPGVSYISSFSSAVTGQTKEKIHSQAEGVPAGDSAEDLAPESTQSDSSKRRRLSSEPEVTEIPPPPAIE